MGSSAAVVKSCCIASVVLFSLLHGSISLANEIYTWTDAQGNIHYSDTPNNQNAEIVDLPATAPVTSTPPSAPSNSVANGLSTSSGLSQPTEQEKQQALEQQEQAKKFCTQAKQNLVFLQQTGRRVYTVLPSGEYHYYNAQERQQEIEKTQQSIKLYCNTSS